MVEDQVRRPAPVKNELELTGPDCYGPTSVPTPLGICPFLIPSAGCSQGTGCRDRHGSRQGHFGFPLQAQLQMQSTAARVIPEAPQSLSFALDFAKHQFAAVHTDPA